jgi:hypothetical protein
VFPLLQREHRHKGVGMFAGADDYGVKIRGVLENFSKVGEFLSFGIFFRGGVEIVRVHVAKRDDILRGYGLEIAAAPPSSPDNGNI